MAREYFKMLKSELIELARKAGLGTRAALSAMTKSELSERLAKQERADVSEPAQPVASAEHQPAAAERAGASQGPAQRPARLAQLAGQESEPRSGETEAATGQTAAVRAKYDVGPPPARHELAELDAGLPELPEGYSDNQIVLLARDPRWLYTYWDVTNEHKEGARRAGGQRLVLRLYDVTDVDFDGENAQGAWEEEIHELARWQYLTVPSPSRHYLVELGYRGERGEWYPLCRSNVVYAPADRPSGRVHDVFVTIPFDRPLVSARRVEPPPPPPNSPAFQSAVFGRADVGPGSSIGMSAGWAQPGLAWSGGWSGLVGSMAAVPSSPMVPGKARSFWLRADAELIVYGATEPDARLTIGGRAVPLSPDGTFYLRIHFPDGVQDFPIEAVAADQEQKRAIHMTFHRRTE
jgi:hypothetical protein